ncbi:MAG: hypothetical protein BZ136_02110 [Methanosphaera sp. rholeuAM74]|nr:MAG: hypothetical protein BZ136_02110 [Methanosphaera sp. rholeuAM74]
MSDYSYFETTADIGIEVVSSNIEDAFMYSAVACFNLITDVDMIEENIRKEVSVSSEDEYALLYDWITELLILFDGEFFVANSYDVKINMDDDGYHLSARLLGDVYDTSKYCYKTEVKAITYHNMEITEDKNEYRVRFIVDL